MAKQFKVLVNTGKAENNKAIDVQQHAGDKGQPVRIKAQAGTKYQLQELGKDKGKNTAPDYVRAKRNGKNLEITFEDGISPDLIIEDYYDEMPAGYNGVIGQAENGSYYEYIPEDPNPKGLIPELADGVQPTSVALGGTEVSPAGAAVGVLAFPLLAPLGLLGGAAAAAAAAGGGGGTTNTTATTTGALDAASDTGTKGDNKTNDPTPDLSGTAPAGSTATVTINGQTYPVTVNPDGTWKFTQPTNLPDGTYYPVLNVTTNGVTTATNLTPFTIDTTPPTIAITASANALGSGQTATVTFTLSEPSTDFTADDIAVTGGSLSNLTQSTTDPKVWTATFTPTAGTTPGSATISVASTKFSDAAGNFNTDGAEANNTVTIKTNATTYGGLDASSDTGTKGDNLTNDTTPTLSGKVPAGSSASVTINGTKYPVNVNPDGTWSFTTPTNLPDGTYTPTLDVVTNGQSSSTPLTPFTIDTTPPTIAITASAKTLVAGETATVTFTLSEASSDFTAADVAVTGGTLSNFAQSATNPLVWTATFTPASTGTSASISVASDKFQDAAGNNNKDGADANNTVSLTTNALASGQLSPNSDNATGIPNDNKTNDPTPELTGKVPTGSTATVTINGQTYPVTVNPDGTWSFTQPTNLPDGTYTPVLNVTTNGTTTSTSITPFTIDTTPPKVEITSPVTTLAAGASTTLTFTVSEATTDLTIGDIQVSGGTLGPLQQSATNPLVYTATFTAASGATAASVKIDSNKFSDAAGNNNTDGADANNTWSYSVTPGNTPNTSSLTALTIEPITGDNILSATEQGATSITVKGQVTGKFAAGDVVTLVVGGQNITATVGADGSYVANVPVSAFKADTDLKIEGSVKGTGGDTATAAQSYTLEATDTPVKTALAIDPITADNIIGVSETGGDIAVTGHVTGKYAAGDEVTLTVNGKTFKGTAAADGSFSIKVPATDLLADSDTTVDGSVSGTGGTTATALQNYGIDANVPVNPTPQPTLKTTVTIDPITGDNLINASELANANTTITGKVTGAFAAGDKVTLTLNGKDYTANVDAQGAYSLSVPTAQLQLDPDTKIEASVTGTGGSYASAAQDYAIDTGTTPSTTTLSINPVTADNIINASEAAATTIAVTGKVGGKFAVGDSVTLTVNGKTYTGNVTDTAGNYSVNVPTADLLADADSTIDGSVKGTGGTKADAIQNYGIDSAVTPSYPDPYNPANTGTKTAISLDAITGDNVLGSSETGNINVTGKVSGAFAVGDTVTLIVNGKAVTGKVLDTAGNFSIAVPAADLLADKDSKIEAEVTGTNGDKATAAQDYIVEANPFVPTQTALSIDPITGDNFIASGEKTGNITITGKVSGKFAVNDTVTLTVNGNTYTGKVLDAAGNYSISVPATDVAADSDSTITGSVTGTGGTAATAMQNYAVDSAPANNSSSKTALTIDPITGDNVITATEGASTTTTISGKVTGAFKAGDTVTLTLNSKAYTAQVAADGSYQVKVTTTDLKNDSDTKIEGTVTGTGGDTATAAQTYTVEATDTPTKTALSIHPVTADNIISTNESTGSINVTGAVTGKFAAGDVVTLTINGKTFTGAVDAGGNYSVAVPAADLLADADTTIDATVTGTGGSSAVALQNYGVDNNAPAPTPAPSLKTALTINPVTGDNILSAADQGATTVPVSGKVTGAYVAGDTVTLLLNGTSYTASVAADGSYTVNVQMADLKADSDHQITGTVSGTGGDTATAAQTYSVENSANAGKTTALAIDPVTADNIIGSTESAGSIAITGKVSGAFAVGDTVTLTVNGKTFSGTVAAGGTYSIPVPAADLLADSDTTVDGRVIGTGGTTAAALQNYGVDPNINPAPSPSVKTALTINPITGDNILGAGETTGTIAVTGKVSGTFAAGDTVTLLVNNKTYTGTAAADGSYSINVPAAELAADADTKIEGSVTGGNGGQFATAAQDYVVDATSPSAPTKTALSLDPITADNVITSAENTGTINVTGTVTGKYAAGDKVTLTVNGKTFTGVADAAGKFAIPVPASDLVADADTTVDATVTGTGGTAATALQNYAVDTATPAPAPTPSLKTTLTIEPITGDNVLTATEGVAANTTVKGQVTGAFAAGDTVTLTLNGKSYTAQVAADGSWSTSVPTADLKQDADSRIEGSVTGTNGSAATAAQDYVVEAGNTATQTVLSIDKVTADNIIGVSEATGPITVTGAVTGKFAAGDVVTLTINGKTFTGAADAAGKFAIAVPAADLLADADTTIDGLVNGTGGTTAAAVQNYGIDPNTPVGPIPPATLKTTLTIDAITGDNLLGSSDLANGNTTITGKVSGTFAAGDKVTLTLNGKDYTTNVDASGNYTLSVSTADLKNDPDTKIEGSVTGTGGSYATAAQDYIVDTGTPPTQTALSINPVTADNIINSTEASASTIAVTGKVSGAFAVGDTVTLTVNGKAFTGVVTDTSGNYSVNVNTADLLADSDSTIDGTVTGTGGTKAGAIQNYGIDNPSLPPLQYDTALIIDPITGDNLITLKEGGANAIEVTGRLTGTYAAGDTVTLTINNKTFTAQVDADGKYSVAVPVTDLKADADLKVDGSAQGTGGTTATAAQVYQVETSANAGKLTSLSIDPVTSDNILDGFEANAGTITLTGKVGGAFAVGNVVTLTINGKSFTGTVTDASGNYSVSVPAADLQADADTRIDGQVTGTGGSTATAIQDYGLSANVTPYVGPTNSLKTALTIDPITNDNILSLAEQGATSVAVTGTVTGAFAAGDVVTLTLNGNKYTALVDANGKYSVSVALTDLKGDSDTRIEGSVYGTGSIPGTVATAAQDYVIETAANAGKTTALSIDPVTADNIIGSGEGSGSITLTGKVTGAFAAGDVVTLNINNKLFTATVAAGGTYSVAVPASDLLADSDSTVTGSVTGTGGTSATALQDYGVDPTYVAPTPTNPDPYNPANTGAKTAIAIDAITGDNLLAANETGTINVTGKVSGAFAAGDTVTLYVAGKTLTGKVAADGSYSIGVPAADLLADKDTKIEADVTGTGGDKATAAQDYIVEANPSAPTQTALTIDPITGDNFIAAAEKTGTVNVTGKVSGKFAEGDKVTLNIGGKLYSGLAAADGSYTIAVPAADLVADSDTTVDGSVTGTGGTLANAMQNYVVDTATPAPTPSPSVKTALTIDPITGDNIITTTEGGVTNTTVTGKVSGTFAAGDTVTLVVNGKSFTGTAAADGSYSISVTTSDLKADSDSKIEGSVTGGNGGQLATAAQDYVVETSNTAGKQTALSINAVTADNVISATEAAGGTIAITGKVTGKFASGDTVTLTINGKTFTGAAAADGSYSIAVPAADLLADADTTIDGTVTGTGGTTAAALQNYAVDTNVPTPVVPNGGKALGLTIDIDNNVTGGDGLISAAEKGSATTTSLTATFDPTKVAAGQIVSFTDGVTTKTVTLTAADVTAGKVTSAGWALPAEGATLSVKATLTDGTTTTPDATDSATLDTTVPNGSNPLGLTIDLDASNDGLINATEKGNATTTSVTATFDPTKVSAGDTITISDGTTTRSIILSATDVAAGKLVTTGWPLPADGVTLTVTATLKDAAGNTTPQATDSAKLDLTTPNNSNAVTLDIVLDANNDGYINATEKGSASTTDLKASFDKTKVAAGDILTLSDGTTTKTVTLSATDVSNGYVLSTGWTLPADGGTLNVTATLKDTAGNTTPQATDSARLDTTLPNNGQAVGLTIDLDANNDGTINGTEKGTVSTTSLTATFDPAKVAVGDKVTFSDGVTTKVATLTAADVAAGKVTSTGWALPAEDATLNVTAVLADAAGNATPQATDSAKLDATSVSVKTALTIDPIATDNILSLAEQGVATVAVTGKVSGAYAAGDIVTLTINGKAYTAAAAADGSYTVNVNTSDLIADTDTQVDGKVTGTGGDTATALQDYQVETSANVGKITALSIDPVTADNILDATEAAAGSVNITGKVTGAFAAGDVVTLTLNGKTFSGAVNASGTYSIPVSAADLAADGDTTVDATVTGTGGTAATALQNYGLNTTPPTPPNNNQALGLTIDLDKSPDDGFINATEKGSNTDTSLTATFTPADVAVGQVVTFTVGTTVKTVTLTAADVAAGKVTSTGWALPSDGSTLTATAVLSDALGRSTPVATDTTKLDLTTPNNNQALGLSIVLDANPDDGYINAAEKGGATTTDLKATFDSTKVAAGDVITFTVGSTTKTVTLTSTDVTAGYVLSTGWTLPADGGTLTATAVLKDVAGNATPTATDTAVLDTTTPNNNQTLGLTIDADTNNDGFINATEKTGTTTSLTATFDGTKAAVGDVVTFTAGGVTKTVALTSADLTANKVTSTGWTIPADGSTLTATATLKDAAGNTTPVATDTAIVDTSVFSGIGIVIKTDLDNNQLVGSTELAATAGKMNVEVTLPANVKAGDVLLITGTGNSDQSITLTSAQISAGKVVVDFTAPANGTNFVTTAKVTDAAGNASTTVSDQATINTQAAGAPTVTIVEDANNDGYINASELSGTIEVNIKAPTGAVAGDQLIVTKPDGSTQTITLTSADLTNGVTISYTAPSSDGALTFSAVHKDSAGNISAAGSDSATLDRSNLQTGLGITITTDADNNALISASELSSSGSKVAVKVTLAPGAAVGDTLTITGSGNTDQTVTLTQADITAGYVTASFNPSGDNTTFVATASLKDAAGNTGGPVQDSATMRTTSAGAPTVTITEDANNDGLISASELVGTIDVEYTLPATAAAGDTLVITKPDGSTENVLLQAADITAGKVSRSYTAPADGSTVTTSAQLKDAAGNLGATGSDSAKLDLTTPNNNQALGLSIDADTNNDGTINKTELGSATTTSLTATFDKTKVAVGDVVTFTVGTTVQTHALTSADITAGAVTTTGWALPAEGATLTATATLKDAAGNTTPLATDTAKLDTTAPNGGNAVTLTIDLDANNNGTITDTEKGSNATTSLSATFDKTKVAVGDIVTFSDGSTTKDVVLTQNDINAGSVTSTGWNLPANGATMNVTAVLKDAAGNATPQATDSAVMQFASNATATIDITSISTDTGTSGSDFVTSDTTLSYSGKVNGWVAGLGDRVMVQLYSSPNTFSPAATAFVTPNADGTWTWDNTAATRTPGLYNLVATIVSATGTTAINSAIPTQDANGNYTGGGFDQQVITIDTTAVNSDINLAISIKTDADNSGTVSATELAGASTFTTEATFDATKAKAGDVITFTATNGVTALASQTVTLTAADVTAGKVTVNFAVPTGTDIQTVKANYTDLAGNTATGTQPQDSAGIDATAPTIAITSDKATLKKGETALITFTLSEASNDFAQGSVSVTGGNLGSWTKVSATVYTAVFTPIDNTNNASASISVASGKFSDVAGNPNADGADANNTLAIAYDTSAPVAVADTVTGTEDSLSLTGSVATNDTGKDGTETFSLVNGGTGTYGTLVLNANGSYTYNVTSNSALNAITANVTETFAYKVTDALGNTSTANLVVTLTPANDAPIISATTNVALPTIQVNAAAPANGDTTAGALVSDLFAAITDPDGASVVKGIAITGVGHTGTLYYSLDGGTTWQTPGSTLSASNALLLSGNARVYYKPTLNDTATWADALWYRAWDQTDGKSVGTLTDTSANGGTNAYSTAFGKIGINMVPTIAFSSMTKDSSTGTANADWTTSDVSAGRLVSGTLSAPLETGEKVAVYSNGTLIGYATVNGQAWEITDTNGYSAGWTYTAKIIDAAGMAGPVQTQLVNVDTTVIAPVITGVKDSATTSITNGGSTTKTITTVSGTAEANATVYVYDNKGGNLVATTIADGSGNWTATIAAPTGGAHTFAATQLDPYGNKSVYSNLWSVTGSAGANLVSNGDFSSGATGFTSGATIVPSSSFDYASSSSVVSVKAAGTGNAPTSATNTGTVNANLSWSDKYETTGGNPDGAFSGNMLVGSIASSSKTVVWQSTVAVEAGKSYTFTIDYQANLNGGGSLGVDIAGSSITYFSTGGAVRSGHLTVNYKATTTGNITLAYWGTNSYNGFAYGDIGLDNMVFSELAPVADSSLVAGANADGATPGNDSLTYAGGTLDTLGGGDTITATGTDLQAKLAAGGRIVGGADIDILKLAAGTTLDLTAITNNQTVKPIQEVEVFTLQGNSKLVMSANDVLSLGGSNATTMSTYTFASTTQDTGATGSTASAGKVQFVVNGTSTDRLSLSALATDGVTTAHGVTGNTGLTGQWDYKGTVKVTGVDGVERTFKVYDHSTTDAQVLVDLPITVDTLKPLAITAISTDSGIATDFITNDQTLVYSGSVPVEFNPTTEEVRVVIKTKAGALLDASAIGAVTVNGTNWTWNNSSATLAENDYIIEATIVTKGTTTPVASYGSAGTTTQAMTIDITAPNGGAAPTVTIVEDNNPDNGLLTGAELGNATNVTVKAAWTGTVKAGDQVVLSDGTTTKTVTVSATDVTNKFVTTTFAKPADGSTLTVTALIADTAGNTTTTASDSAYVDATSPTQTLQFTSMTKDSSTGTAHADWTTGDGSAGRLVSGTLSAPLAADEKVAVYSNGTLIGYATVNAAGTAWAITDTSGYASASSWTYTAKVVDAAGNEAPTQTQVVNTDLTATAPVITAVSNGSAITSGTGNVTGSSTSAITSISGTSTEGNGSVVEVYDNTNGNLVGKATVSGGTWTLSGLNINTSGSHMFKAIQTDTFGNSSALSNSHTVNVDIDLTTNGTFTAGTTGYVYDFSASQQRPALNGIVNDPNGIWYTSDQNAWDIDNTYTANAKIGSTNLAASGSASTGRAEDLSGTVGTLTWTTDYGNVYGPSQSQYDNPDGTMTGNTLIANMHASAGWGAVWKQSLNIVAGQKYTLTFDYMHNDADLAVVFGDVRAQFWTSAYEFGHLTATFTATQTGTIFYGIAARGSGSANPADNGDLALDNIKLTLNNPVPADGTLAGTSLAGADENANNLSYTSGVLDTLGGGDTITATSSGLQTTLANGGRISGSAGVDTLKLASGTTLDLTTITNNQTVKPIEEVEIFTLQGGSSVLTMSANNVLSLGGANLSGYDFTSVTNAQGGGTISAGKVQMVVNGNTGDKLVLNELFNDGVTGQNGTLGNTGLGGEWTYKGDFVKNGTTYKVYDHSTTQAQVLVDIDVTVDTQSPIKISSISTDSGTSVADFSTNDQSLVYSGKLPSGFDPAQHRVLVEVLQNGTLVSAAHKDIATINGSNWTWDNTDQNLPAGSYTIRATVVGLTNETAVSSFGTNGTSTQVMTIDTAGPVSPTITLNSVTADNLVNADEASGLVAVTGTVGGEVRVGDAVALLVNGTTYTGTVQAGNTFSINVAGSDLAADADKTINATLVASDVSGNTTTATATKVYTVDTNTVSITSVVATGQTQVQISDTFTNTLSINRADSLTTSGGLTFSTDTVSTLGSTDASGSRAIAINPANTPIASNGVKLAPPAGKISYLEFTFAGNDQTGSLPLRFYGFNVGVGPVVPDITGSTSAGTGITTDATAAKIQISSGTFKATFATPVDYFAFGDMNGDAWTLDNLKMNLVQVPDTQTVADGGLSPYTTGTVSGMLANALQAGQSVDVYNTATNTKVGTATVSGTAWSLAGVTLGNNTQFEARIINSGATLDASSAYTVNPTPTNVPKLQITDNFADAIMGAGAPLALTFRFDQPVSGFDTNDITVTNGTKGTLTQLDSQTWVMTVMTPTTGSGTVSVTVNNAGFTSTSSGQAGTGSTTHSQDYDVNYTEFKVDLAESNVGTTFLNGDDAVIANNSTAREGISLAGGDDSLTIGGQNTARLALAAGSNDYFYGGTGTDTLKLAGAGLTLDLTNVNVKTNLTGFEAVDLTGTGNNTLKLNLASVLDLSDNDKLVVLGNAGDALQIVRTAGVTANETASNVTYEGQVYKGYDLNNDGVADLLVQSTINSITFSG